jgi:hypothetical protein
MINITLHVLETLATIDLHVSQIKKSTLELVLYV